MIEVRETLPGAGAASSIMTHLERLGIKDIQLFFDKQIKMWAVVQVKYTSSSIWLPESYNSTEQEPYLLFWCKNDLGCFREPNIDDVAAIVKMVTQAPAIWAEGEKRADKFDKQDEEKDRKHKERFHDRIHSIAKPMKKAIKEGKL